MNSPSLENPPIAGPPERRGAGRFPLREEVYRLCTIVFEAIDDRGDSGSTISLAIALSVMAVFYGFSPRSQDAKCA